MEGIYEMYEGVVDYAKHLEDVLKEFIGEEAVAEIRKQHITPYPNVAKEWTEEDK